MAATIITDITISNTSSFKTSHIFSHIIHMIHKSLSTTLNHHKASLQIVIYNIVSFQYYPRVNSQQLVRNRSQTKETWHSVTAQLAMASSIARLASNYRSLAMASGIARLASDEGILAVASCFARLRQAMNRQVTGSSKSSLKVPNSTMFNPKNQLNCLHYG